MNKKFVFAGLLFTSVTFLLMASCDKKVAKFPVAPTPPPPGACDTITYQKHIKKIIDDNCVSCHGTSSPNGGVSLTNFTQVKTAADNGRIKARVIDGNPSFMPPSGQLPADQKNLIQCWLENGKKEQ